MYTSGVWLIMPLSAYGQYALSGITQQPEIRVRSRDPAGTVADADQQIVCIAALAQRFLALQTEMQPRAIKIIIAYQQQVVKYAT